MAIQMYVLSPLRTMCGLGPLDPPCEWGVPTVRWNEPFLWGGGVDMSSRAGLWKYNKSRCYSTDMLSVLYKEVLHWCKNSCIEYRDKYIYSQTRVITLEMAS